MQDGGSSGRLPGGEGPQGAETGSRTHYGELDMMDAHCWCHVCSIYYYISLSLSLSVCVCVCVCVSTAAVPGRI